VLEVTKQIAHHAKVSSCGLHGGEDFGIQRRKLGGAVDIVVSSPGRLLQHYQKEHVFFSQVRPGAAPERYGRTRRLTGRRVVRLRRSGTW
jgi:hypothetical protein